MSPEQASMSADLDTRTDVYSLGALLYELLAGTRAFEFRDTPFPEMLRRIREVEPPPPSARFSAQSPDATERAALRGGTPRSVRRELRGELEWIVARAMAKERDRRYGSAADLAVDLERHLEGLPVAAGPPSGLYRARKFLERHRFESAAAAALLVALVAFSAMTALQSRRLARALANEERERATATQVSEFLVALLEQPDPAIARGADPTVKQALEWGAARIERDLADQPEIQARLLETIGRVQINLGAWDKAEPVLAKALELRRRLRGPEHPEVAAVLQLLAELEFDRARFERSLAYAEEALAQRRRLLPPNDPAVAESLDVLALLRRRADEMAAAEALHREALAIRVAAFGTRHPAVAESHNFIGIVRRQSGDLVHAEESYREALAIWRSTLGADHPKTAMAMNNLALTLHVRGDHRAALALFEELVPLRRKLLGDSHPDLMVTLSNQAKLLHDMRDLAGAEAVYREALAIGRRSVGEEHPHTAVAWADLSSVLVKLGRLEEANDLARRSLAVRERIYGTEHMTVAASLAYLAEVEEARGELAAAEALHERGLAILRSTSVGAVRIADALETQALLVVRRGDPARALPLLDEASALLATSLPESDRRRAHLDAARGHCLARLGRLAEAEPLLTSALARLATFETTETAEARQWLAEAQAPSAR
jgi:tetratricopeptide (TPR) repeat protein